MWVWLLIGLLVSIGWHIGKLLFELAKEVIFTRLHAADWYAVLCKKKPKPIKPHKNIIRDGTSRVEDYKGTSIGFITRQ